VIEDAYREVRDTGLLLQISNFAPNQPFAMISISVRLVLWIAMPYLWPMQSFGCSTILPTASRLDDHSWYLLPTDIRSNRRTLYETAKFDLHEIFERLQQMSILQGHLRLKWAICIQQKMCYGKVAKLLLQMM
jgi:hypothetical protein